MDQAKRIIKVISKEEVENETVQLIPHNDTSTIEYIENGKQKRNFL